MNKTKKTVAVLLSLSALSLSANCIDMTNNLICEFDDETIKSSHKIDGIKYLLGKNKKVESMEVNLTNKDKTIYLNLSTYPNLKSLKLTKNPTSKVYIKFRSIMIQIEDKKVELENSKY